MYSYFLYWVSWGWVQVYWMKNIDLSSLQDWLAGESELKICEVKSSHWLLFAQFSVKYDEIHVVLT